AELAADGSPQQRVGPGLTEPADFESHDVTQNLPAQPVEKTSTRVDVFSTANEPETTAAEVPLTGTDGARLLSFPAPTWPTKASESGRKSAPKITRNGSLPIRRASGGKRKVSATQMSSRLSVAETTYRGAKAWRVSLGKRGQNLLSFRVRPS